MRVVLGVAQVALLASILIGQGTPRELPSFIFTSATKYEPQAWIHGGERFPEGAHLVLVSGEEHRNMTPQFFGSADATVSYDGRRILFAGRPTKQDHWQIWQMDVTGGAPHRLVATADDLIRPLYLADGKLVYTRINSKGSVIEVATSEGVKSNVLTHAPGWYLTDDVLHDDRILFESRGELFTVYPDGTGVESLRCDHGPHRSGGRQLSSGDVVFAVDGKLARYKSPLAVQQSVTLADQEFAGRIAEVTKDEWIVAARPHWGGMFALYRASLQPPGLTMLDCPNGVNAVEPVLVRERVRPRDFPSGLVESRKTGNLLCLNVRESMERVEGTIHFVRIYTRDAAGDPKVLGQTAVASDGSFYVEVPADRPIRMEVLDATGRRLAGEEHWFWMRPSEQRICVGCHAGPERAPENKVPEILNQILKPVKMLGDQGATK